MATKGKNSKEAVAVKKAPVVDLEAKVEAPVMSREEREALEDKRHKILQYAKKGVAVKEEVIEVLMKEPLTQFMIMKNPLEKGTPVHEVGINEQVFIYPKGVLFTAPQSIIEMLAHYYNVEMSAGDAHRIDRDPTVQGALA